MEISYFSEVQSKAYFLRLTRRSRSLLEQSPRISTRMQLGSAVFPSYPFSVHSDASVGALLVEHVKCFGRLGM